MSLVNGAHIWQMANKLGKIQQGCSAKYNSFRVDETDWQIFCPALATFRLAQKVW